MRNQAQPWLYAAWADLLFVISPAFVVTGLVEIVPEAFSAGREVTPWMWLLLVVGIDVAHVYSTLYRTYLDPAARERHQWLLIAAPVLCWVGGAVLYSVGSLVFWRVLAYLAVFHFVRQQYGFLRLYARRDSSPEWMRRLEAAAIYSATLYPLLYWHTHPRSFVWFIEGDFLRLPFPAVARFGLWLYLAILATYVGAEVWRSWRAGSVNAPKNLILLGTALSWYAGIVRHNGDLAFTVTNVVAHGVPYMALIWFYQRKQQRAVTSEPTRRFLARWFRPAMIPAFLGLLLVLAYFEEGLWDVFVWREHLQFFGWISFLPPVDDEIVLRALVPLLALPQATHYVIDGFIWRVREMRPAT